LTILIETTARRFAGGNLTSHLLCPYFYRPIGEHRALFSEQPETGTSTTSITMVQATSMIITFGSEKLCVAGTRAAPTLRAAVPRPSTPFICTREPPSRYPAV